MSDSGKCLSDCPHGNLKGQCWRCDNDLLRRELTRLIAELAEANREIERLRAENDDARSYIAMEDGSKLHIRNLLRCGIRSLKGKRGAFWSHVADAFGVGCTSAHRLCRFVNINPDTGEINHDDQD